MEVKESSTIKTIPQASHCSECGAPLASHWPKGLCPRCALKGALEMKLEDYEAQAAAQREAATSPHVTETSGTRIGNYKLLEQIGEGGFGVVWMAEQEEPVRRRVALKIIKLGMDTRQVIARFEAERQALAMMDHTNIAKVLEAGATETGRPFFVMELVRGIKITDYCDQNQLSTSERLHLFVQVCQAIQHAHQKGIIHRDIKPSNVLVTLYDGVAVPKVIDFGIAKATEGRLTDKTVFTSYHQFIGTPAYVSPEQAEMSGLDVDTRSDIYSLGVLLYELLTGQTPFDTQVLKGGFDSFRRTLLHVEPPRPSTRLTRALNACDTNDRKKETGIAVRSEDEGNAESRQRTRLKEQIRVVRGDLDWIVMKCLEKDRRRRYETANGLAMDIQRHLNHEPVVACPPSNFYRFQKLVHRNKLLVSAAAAVLAVLLLGVVVSTRQAVRATRAEHEQSYLRQQAEEAQTEAETNEQHAREAAARSAEVARLMKNLLEAVGPAVANSHDAKVLRALNQSAEQLTSLVDQPQDEANLREALGLVYRELGEFSHAELMLQKALSLRKALATNGPDAAVATAIHNLAELSRLQRNRNQEAADGFRAALAMRRQLLGEEHRDVAASLFGLAEVLRRGDGEVLAEAEKAHREALAMRQKLLGPKHLEVADSLVGLGILLRRAGQLEESEKLLQEGLTIQRQMLGNEHRDIGYTLYNLGSTRRKSPEKVAAALEALRDAYAVQKSVLGDHRDTAETLTLLGEVCVRQNLMAEAEAAYIECLRIRKKVLTEDPSAVANALYNLSEAYRLQGKWSEAENGYRQASIIRERFLQNNWSTFHVRILLGESLAEQKRFTEAEPLLTSGYEGLQQSVPADRKNLLDEALQKLARFYEKTGRSEKAAECRKKLVPVTETSKAQEGS